MGDGVRADLAALRLYAVPLQAEAHRRAAHVDVALQVGLVVLPEVARVTRLRASPPQEAS